ncbi:MAG: class I tRNA ligase family protein, partial [Muribaculaceae bacterium]|nr:class I tRNA ligase family protein [Muribaculaceae bacterium]
WMTNIKDWCISRQLWWGHQIPAWYLPDGGYVVAENEEEALLKAIEKSGNSGLTLSDLRRDPDCLDTWFSSWLWPISLFNGILDPDDKEFRYYYPTADLVTAPDIIFFWVARMIIAGYEFTGEKPFNNVYFTGIVRDKLGRKMSKSLGNSPDPLELIDRFGADGVRMGLMLAAPAGNDIMYDDSLCEQGRNFCNKIWNAFRLVKGWETDASLLQPEAARLGVEWMNARLADALLEMEDLMGKFRISEALMVVYKLFWDEFSSWYLEIVKPGYQQPIDAKTYEATLEIFDVLLRALHPFMPFITEELWQALSPRKDGESLMLAQLPKPDQVDRDLIARMETLKEVVAGIRTIRKQKQIPQKEALSLDVKGEHNDTLNPILVKIANLSEIASVAEKGDMSAAFIVGATEYSVPLQGNINVEEERAKLEKELAHLQGFLGGVQKKLSNEKFVANAPEKVIELERKKEADSIEKINAVKKALESLK